MHSEVTAYVPFPAIVLMGCQAWPPRQEAPGRCPVCDQGVNADEHRTYCAVCDSMSPRNEANVRSQLVGVRGKSGQEHATQAARASLLKRARNGLTEGERRALWNGHKGGLRVENPTPTNVAKVARDWLRERGWEPDWTLVLDRRGNTVARYDTGTEFDRRGNVTGWHPPDESDAS